MADVSRKSAALVTGVGLSFTLGMASMPTASAAPQPRFAPSYCSTISPTSENGYVVVDTTDNTQCVVDSNGTWLWTNGVRVAKGKGVVVRARICPVSRGDVGNYATVYFIRGNIRVAKRVRIRSGCTIRARHKLNRAGNWAIVVTYRNQAVSAIVNAA